MVDFKELSPGTILKTLQKILETQCSSHIEKSDYLWKFLRFNRLSQTRYFNILLACLIGINIPLGSNYNGLSESFRQKYLSVGLNISRLILGTQNLQSRINN